MRLIRYEEKEYKSWLIQVVIEDRDRYDTR